MARKHDNRIPDNARGYVRTDQAKPYQVTEGEDGRRYGTFGEDRGPKRPRGRRVLKWTAIAVGTLFVAGTLATNGGEQAPEAPQPVETVQPADPTPTPEETTQTPDDGVGVPPPPAEIPEADVDDLFVEYVRQETQTLGAVPDATIIEFAQSVCAAYDRGATPEDVVGVILQHGTSDAQVSDYAVVAGAGVAAYCPEHGDMVTDAAGINQ